MVRSKYTAVAKIKAKKSLIASEIRKLSKFRHADKIIIVLFLVVFAGLGSIIINSRAASPSAGIEAEAGDPSGNATKGSDTAASGGGYLQFGGVTTGVTSKQTGIWSAATTWSNGRVPMAGDIVVIAAGHNVTYDITSNATARPSKLTVNGQLIFQSNKTVQLESTGNVVVMGALIMKPANATLNHTLKFMNVDESKFVGGGLDVLDTDVGLWVMGAGKLDILGTPKTGWTRAAGTISQGTKTITLSSAPTGWQVGDEISIAPTEPISIGTVAWSGFDVSTITAISGSVVTINTATVRPHPQVNNKWTAEVMNLTRNARIEGTGDGTSPTTTNGRGHIFIRSTQPQSIKYLGIRHMGARRSTSSTTNGNVIYTFVVGRYALHIHMSGEGSRGTMVEGVVARQTGGPTYVPHGSHGITMKDSISYDSWDRAFWWDPPADHTDNTHNSDDLLWDHNIAAIVKADPAFRGHTNSGYMLATGKRVALRNSAAVGIQGSNSASGFTWSASTNHHPDNVWDFRDNITHNNKVNGVFVWQNDSHGHVVNRLTAYNNMQSGIEHGAYLNSYTYFDTELFGNGYSILQHGVARGVSRPDGYKLAFERFNANSPIIMTKHAASNVGTTPNLYKDCTVPKIIVDEAANNGKNAGWYDFVNCNLEPSQIEIKSALPGSRVRVQRANRTAFQIDHLGTVTTIPAFY